MENYEVPEDKFTPKKDLAKLLIGLNIANSILMGCALYGYGVIENKSFNPFLIISHYQELSKNNLQKIKMSRRVAGNLEISISIRDLRRAD